MTVILRPMQVLTVQSAGEAQPAVIDRLAGNAMHMLTQACDISAWLRIEVYEAEAEGMLEESGRLVCLPVSDESFGLQLAFALERAGAPDLVVLLHVHPQFLAQWPPGMLHQEQAFRFDHAAEHELRIDAPIRNILLQLLPADKPADFSSAMLHMEYALQLLRRSVDQLNVHFAPCVVPACRFLAYDSERDKIHKARAILDAHYDERLTIKDLARKVAMNECYLKKGFKTLTGSTIHEYIAARRIASARHMLQAEGRSVTEVAALLGYSSISHFSTAFKKATGLKPCELLS